MESKTVSEPTLHELDKRIASIEDWRDSESDDRSNVREQIFTRLGKHDEILHGKDGLVTSNALMADNLNEIKRMIRWVMGAVFLAVFALIWTAATNG